MVFWMNAPEERLPALFPPNSVSPPHSILDILSLPDSEIDWKWVAARALEAPQELKHRDAARNHTALFLAIQRDAPPYVIQTFLQLYPEAARQVQRLGLSPLHLSVARGTPPEVVQYIVDAWPEAASARMNDGCVPLHFVRNVETAKILLKAYPEALLCSNNASYLPLHRVATASYASAKLLQLLVDAAETREIQHQQINANTFHGMTPLHVACEMVERDLIRRKPVCPVKWEKLEILARAKFDNLRTTAISNTGVEDFCLLHVLLDLAHVPSCIVEYVISTYPEQRSQLDDRGRSCLSIAASKRETSLQTLTLLLKDPIVGELATKANRLGRFPLHYAAQSGRKLDDVLQLLWKAAPQALTTPEPQTGLYPVLLAALAPGEQDKLNTIFGLLSETPWLLPRTKASHRNSHERVQKLPWGRVLDDRAKMIICLFVLPIVAAFVAGYLFKPSS